MIFEAKTVRRTINKAFLKEPIERRSFTVFKDALEQLQNDVEIATEKNEHEEHFKNFLVPFFNKVGFQDYSINTSGRIDLAIQIGGKGKDPVGVMMEVKRPSNKAEMISNDRLNRKALHEAVLYYLEQRIDQGNDDLKHVIITNITHWFIFDAQEFERCFYRPSALCNAYKEWKENRKVSSNTDFMYDKIASFISESEATISGISLPFKPVTKLLKGSEGSDYEKRLISLYKFFSPIHLLKEPFANDSNSLNKEFYREFLYIIGLEETKEGSTRYIRRAEETNRHSGSIIENTIRILDAEDHLSTLKKSRSSYGEDRDEQLFSVAMELGITWMNRILFLKLLEAQLFRYHRKDGRFKFLNYDTIDGLDELNKLFFQVLARKEKDRSADVNEKFGHIPYLNSSLFDVSSLEHQTTRISGLDDHTEMPVYGKSVLTDSRGETLNTLDYLFWFLEAYDFSAEGSEEIRDESKSLINASVLGLIFEKINGYKDGSFYTPGFITEYMARETLQKSVIDSFNSNYEWKCESISDLQNEIHRDRLPYDEANAVINGLTICDPAVGSGHFLVSCLNELIAIKSELRILCDTDMNVLRGVEVTVENDELIIGWEDEGLFEYDVSHAWQGTVLKSRKVSAERERVQKALFHEKRFLIENCLFGVDINPNSVKICRLRLWIELLKRAYYTKESDYMELEVLPNIDINIKKGNSLVSRFELDADLNTVFKDSEHTLDDYKQAVRSYKQTGDRREKARLQELIDDIKDEYSTTLTNLRPINQKLSKARGRLEIMRNDDLFGDVKFTQKEIKKQEKKLKKLEEQKSEEESGAFYNEAFEWRFEFPEVLNEEGVFTGFDVVIGNPPYIRQEQLGELKPYLKSHFEVYKGTADLYVYFYELSHKILRRNGIFSMITANKFMKTNYGAPLRDFLSKKTYLLKLIDFGELPVFEEASTFPLIIVTRNIPIEKQHFEFYQVKELIPEAFTKHLTERRKKLDDRAIEGDNWSLADPIELDIIEKMREKGTELEKYLGKEMKYGIKTGYNKAFIIDDNLKNELIGRDPKSAELIKPFVSGDDVRFYRLKSIKKYLIFTRRGVEIDKYPVIKNYLSQFKNNLKPKPSDWSGGKWSGRKPGPYKWYEIQDTVEYYLDFENPKILFPEIAKESRFTFDSTGVYINKTIFSIPSDDKYLLGLLNSKLVWLYLKRVCSSLGDPDAGGRLNLQRIYVSKVPIVNADKTTKGEISNNVDQILSMKQQNPEADTTELEEEIDRMVYELYGLSEQEISVVES